MTESVPVEWMHHCGAMVIARRGESVICPKCKGPLFANDGRTKLHAEISRLASELADSEERAEALEAVKRVLWRQNETLRVELGHMRDVVEALVLYCDLLRENLCPRCNKGICSAHQPAQGFVEGLLREDEARDSDGTTDS